MIRNGLLCCNPFIFGSICYFLFCGSAFSSRNLLPFRLLSRRCCSGTALFLLCTFLCFTHCLFLCFRRKLCFFLCIFLIGFFMLFMKFRFIFLCPFQSLLFPAGQLPVWSAYPSLSFQCFITCYHWLAVQSAAYRPTTDRQIWNIFSTILFIQPVIICITFFFQSLRWLSIVFSF